MMTRQRPGSGLIFLLYIGITILMTMPLITQLGTHIPTAEGSDLWVHEWTFWWVEQALLHWKNPFYTDLLFYPTGTSLTTHNIAWFNIGIWFPLQAAVGNTVAYSLNYILVFTLNAFCMYLLAFGWLRSRSAAVLAGLIYGFWPYTFTQGDHPNMSTIMWLPLALFYLRRCSERRSRRDLLMAGLFIALTGIARWQLLLVASVLLGIYLLYLLSQAVPTTPAPQARVSVLWRRLIRLTIPFIFAGGLTLPLGGPVIYAQLTQNFPEEVLVHEPWFSSSLLSYVLPNSHLALYQSVVEQLPTSLQFHNQRVDFLGYTVLLLALIGLLGYWRQTVIWLFIALVYWLLALGPALQLGNDLQFSIPLPYRWVEEWTLIQIVRQPNRFNAFVGLPLGLMAGYGLLTLRRMAWFRRGFLALTVLCCLLVLGEYRPYPFAMESTHIPQWYRQLADDPEDFAIFGLPPSTRLADKYFMHYQILHQKPMVEGHVSRPTYATFGFMDQSDYLWHLRIHREMKPELVDVTHQLRLLADVNVRYLILHKNFLTEAQLDQFMDWLTYRPTYEDSEVIVYKTAPQLGEDFDVAEWMNGEIGLIRTTYGPDTLPQGEPLHVDARWGTQGAPQADYDACLVIYTETTKPIQRSCYAIGGAWPTAQWQASEVARGDYIMRVDPLLEPGNYTLALEMIPTGAPPERPAIGQKILGPLTVAERERAFAPPSPTQPSNIRFGEQLKLVGFDAAREADRVQVTLYWQATERMERSYKVFVHVVDVSTGALIAQNDSVPRQWTYPTTWWEAGEYVDDRIELTLEQGTSTNIRILVGLYDEETIERLPALSPNGDRFPDDAAPLAELP